MKILTRALATSVKVVLDKLTANDQQAFIKSRFLGNNVLDAYSIASEALAQDDDFLLLSLDIEKAFDSVNWEFLYNTLSGFGFPLAFIQWTCTLNNKKELRIFNNGHSSDPIKVSNSLAQGCNLSPLLFIICIETLARKLRNNSKIKGIKVQDNEKVIGLVADDTMIVSKASPSSLQELCNILIDFEKQSGLHINYDKSVACALGPSSFNYTMHLPRTFKWLNKGESFTYLGLKLQLNPANQLVEDGNWTYSISTLTASLRKLRFSNHSLLGRILLVKTMLASIFVDKMSLLPSPPQEVLKPLNTFFYNYVWQNGIHHIVRNTMEQEIEYGGFKMLNIFLQERSLKFIWIQHLLNEDSDSFWKAQVSQCFIMPINIILEFNITAQKLPAFIKAGSILPPFWVSLLQIWFTTRYINSSNLNPTPNELLQKPVCFNSVYAYSMPSMRNIYNHLKNLGVITLQQFLTVKDNYAKDKHF